MSSDGSPKQGLNVPMILLPTLRTISGRRSSMSGDPLLTPDDSNIKHPGWEEIQLSPEPSSVAPSSANLQIGAPYVSTSAINSVSVTPNIPSTPSIDPKATISNVLPLNARTIYANDPLTNSSKRFCNNKVTTAKYTWWNFIIKNLMEQFSRLANVYFLIISAFQQIPGVSPTGRFTTLGPLIFVLAVTALKELYEDIKRHKQDNDVNNRKVEVLRNGFFQEVLWRDVVVGDIVRVVNKTGIAADMIVLSTSEPLGMCYIETANLDGETNLKVRQARVETAHIQTPEHAAAFKGSITCEGPNNSLYSFNGFLSMDGASYPLTTQQVLLRGAVLRNTKWAYGMVIYTGHDTKLMQNANAAPSKTTTVERLTNYNVIFIFCLEIALSLFCLVGGNIWMKANNSKHWYLDADDNIPLQTFLSLFTFIILFNNLIPISLYVSMEVVKFGQAYLINNDIQMYHPETDTPAAARTSNLNEELGQVRYIFSDKTGTLTCNKMEFRKCTVAGVSYGDSTEGNALKVSTTKDFTLSPNPKPDESHFNFDDPRLLEHLHSTSANAHVIHEFLTLLSVCHTVIPENDNGNIVYQASSPDEAALVSAAAQLGYVFHAKTPHTVEVKVEGNNKVYEVLNVLEFTSDRKRMSVIVKTPEGKLVLYCKGADTVIKPRLAPKQPYLDATEDHLKAFASDGLRTLCLAVAELQPEEYNQWLLLYNRAALAIANRDDELAHAADLIEKNLFLLGATAIEDKLQEGVPEAIHTLAEAGIKIWVLTGDKQETAINIGYSCRLLTSSMKLLVVNHETEQDTLTHLNQLRAEYAPYIGKENPNLAFIIDGPTLNYALLPGNRDALLQIATACKAVICCRVSPLQKANIVRMVRDNLKAVSLAIGDGANDVSMIQAAHVGIGISGEEGLQAARASDYSIAQFRFLVRLLLVHGRWCYRKTSKLILYSFYKNVVLYITQFWFVLFNGWSGQSLYERWTLSQYNVIFTFLPVIMMGIFDQDVSDKLVIQNPQLYKPGQTNYHFNYRVCWNWIFNALFHSCIIFFVCMGIYYGDVTSGDGKCDGLHLWGTVVYTCVVLTVSCKLALEIRYWCWPVYAALLGCVVAWFLWLMIYGVLWASPSFGVSSAADIYWVIYRLFSTGAFYFTMILVPVICLWRDFTFKYINRTYFPQPYHIIQELQHSQSSAKHGTIKVKATQVLTDNEL